MALADYGFDASYEASRDEQPQVLSLDQTNTRSGYVLRPSAAASGLKARMSRIILSVVMAGTGVFLIATGRSLLSPDASGGALVAPIGLYLVIAAMVWIAALVRRPQELEVDKRGRAFHLITRGLRGDVRSRQTIRFEEVVKISMIDHLASLDMRANAMNWDMGRIDVMWQQNKVTPMVTGDVSELEPLLQNLRREVGLS